MAIFCLLDDGGSNCIRNVDQTAWRNIPEDGRFQLIALCYLLFVFYYFIFDLLILVLTLFI